MTQDWLRLGDVLDLSDVQTVLGDHIPYKHAVFRPYPAGLHLQEIKNGMGFSGKTHRVIHAGQFIISKLHTGQRFWDVVPAELNGAIVHRSCLSFNIHPAINPDYFAAYLATNLFFKQVSQAQTKAGRLNLRVFYSLTLPRMRPERQQSIADVWKFSRNSLRHTSDMYRCMVALTAHVAGDLLQDHHGNRLEPLLKWITLGRDDAVRYPIYLTANGRVSRSKLPLRDGTVGILPQAALDVHYLYYCLHHQKRLGLFPSHHRAGDIENRLSRITVALPTLYEQRKIGGLLGKHYSVLYALAVERRELRQVIQTMIEQLFAGTLPVQEVARYLKGTQTSEG